MCTTQVICPRSVPAYASTDRCRPAPDWGQKLRLRTKARYHLAMTEPTKKPKRPYGAYAWALVGLAAGIRALYRPFRAIMHDGFPSACAGGAGCDPAMIVTSYSGQSEVYAPARGTVVETTGQSITIVLADEATLLQYQSVTGGFVVQVAPGDHVGAGQQIGLAGTMRFVVHQIDRTPSGEAVVGTAIEPASWLATHGCRVSAKSHHTTPNAVWCAGGRKLVVPQAVANCHIKLPAPSGYALLPISATME